MTDNSFAAFSVLQAKMDCLPSLRLQSIPAADTLAISVDLNNGFAKHGALYSERVAALIPGTVRFAQQCKSLAIRLIAVSDHHSPDSPEFSGFPPHCLQGTDEPLIVEELRGFIDQTIAKSSTNGFYRLMEHGLIEPFHNFIITGCCTDICVFTLATAIKTWFNEQNRNCRVIVPVSLVDTYDAPAHSASLLNPVFFGSMLDGGIEVVADILF